MSQKNLNTEEKNIYEDIDKLKMILIKKEKSEIKSDIHIKFLLSTLFFQNNENDIKIKLEDIKGSDKGKFFSCAIKFFLDLFSLDKKIRTSLYEKAITGISDTNLFQQIKTLFILQKTIEIKTSNNKYNDLYKIIL